MGLFDAIVIPDELQDIQLPTPEEITYWGSRKERIFWIDYLIDENYLLVELAKDIILLNHQEKDIPENELKPIYLYIYCYGGDNDQCRFLCDLIQSSRIPIITIATGVAMSAGFYIFLAGHKKYAFKHSQLLIHSGSASFAGTASEIEEAQNNYKKELEEWKDYVLGNTSIGEPLFKKNQKKDWYVSGDDLIKLGIIDNFIEKIEDIYK